jgi:uncharacterized membrane protein YbhN (UPF0104 family)
VAHPLHDGRTPAKLRRLGKLAISAGALAFLLYRVDTERLSRALGSLRPGLLAGVLALYVVGQLLSARKWALAAGALGFRRRYRDYARIYFIGMFVNLYGPGTVGGDVARSFMLDDGGRRALAFASVVFDRASGLAILVTIGLGAWVVRSSAELPPSLVWLAAGVVAALLLSWLLLPYIATRVLPTGHRLTRFLLEDLAPLWRRALLGRVAALSAAFHLLEVTAQYVLAHALDVRVPYSYCLVFHPLVTVAASFPVTIGGLGLREGGYVLLLGLVGIEPARAFTMGLLWSVVVLLGGLVGGAALLLGRSQQGRAPLATSVAEVGDEQGLVSGSSRLPGR